ncbi:MAG: addiction module protein [Acidobacteriota bacterium]
MAILSKDELRASVLDLPPQERSEFADEIWLSLGEAGHDPGVPAWHREILDDRIAEDEANPEAGRPGLR